QHPGGMRAGAAKRGAEAQMALQPGRAGRPVDPDLAADAICRPPLQLRRQGGGRRCALGLEQRLGGAELDDRVDADAEAAQGQSGTLDEARQAADQLGISGGPVQWQNSDSSRQACSLSLTQYDASLTFYDTISRPLWQSSGIDWSRMTWFAASVPTPATAAASPARRRALPFDIDRGLLGHLFNGYSRKHVKQELK